MKYLIMLLALLAIGCQHEMRTRTERIDQHCVVIIGAKTGSFTPPESLWDRTLVCDSTRKHQ